MCKKQEQINILKKYRGNMEQVWKTDATYESAFAPVNAEISEKNSGVHTVQSKHPNTNVLLLLSLHMDNSLNKLNAESNYKKRQPTNILSNLRDQSQVVHGNYLSSSVNHQHHLNTSVNHDHPLSTNGQLTEPGLYRISESQPTLFQNNKSGVVVLTPFPGQNTMLNSSSVQCHPQSSYQTNQVQVLSHTKYPPVNSLGLDNSFMNVQGSSKSNLQFHVSSQPNNLECSISNIIVQQKYPLKEYQSVQLPDNQGSSSLSAMNILSNAKETQINRVTCADTSHSTYPSESSNLQSNSSTKLSQPVAKTHLSESYCKVCDVEFGSVALLREHKEQGSFVCRLCEADFNDHKQLEAHVYTHRRYSCTTCRIVYYSRRDLIKHVKENPACTPHPVKCATCQKTLKNKNSLRAHMLIHSKEKITCFICEKRFSHPYKIKDHIRSVHTAYEHIECEICHNICYGPIYYKHHVVMCHGESKLCTCPQCGVLLKSELSLKFHIQTHDTTVRLCQLCGESFEGINKLKLHKEKQHSKKGLFPCTTCNEKFTLQIDLVRHKRSRHKTIRPSPRVFCEICGKMYKGLEVLKKHMNIHTGDKTFECTICGKHFNQKVTLNTHMRVHSSVGKYFCDVCGKSFKWKQTLENHVKKCGVTERK